jgi:adenylylsulfate kinase
MKGAILWLTGLSGAGKTTIANGLPFEILDGDVVRTNLSKGLGFSKEDRDINVERIAFVANLLAKHSVVVVVAAISPYRETRDKIKSLYRTHEDGSQKFWEVYVKADVETCKSRDPKGLYKRAMNGEIKNFTGISDPYEEPLNPDIVLDTTLLSPSSCRERLIDALHSR